MFQPVSGSSNALFELFAYRHIADILNRLPNNHINFEKCSQLAKQVMEFNEWKKVNCPFERLPNVIAYLQNSAVLNENTLSMASFECETPENTEEKDRYRTVKAETKQQLLQQLQDQHQQSQ